VPRAPGVPNAFAAIVAIVCVVATACSGGDDDGTAAHATATTAAPATTAASTLPIPGDEWETASPESLRLDEAKLEELARLAETGKSNCFLVVRDAKIAGEWYFRGTDQDTAQEIFSATKSVASTLVGIAQDDGDLTIDEPASTWIDEWKGTPSEAVTVRDLVSNDSGREWSLGIDYGTLVREPDQTAFAVGLTQQHAPGTVWAYNNSAIQTLQRVVQDATGEDVTQFAHDRLFAPLGMDHTKMTTDGVGNAKMYMGVQSTCRDMARFGLMALNRGQWGDEQVVSTEWIDAATRQSSTDLNAAYGYLWWLNKIGPVAGPLAATDPTATVTGEQAEGQLVPGAPDSLFWALGLGNQTVQVDPATNTVVVRLGSFELQPTPPTFGRDDTARVVTEAIVDN
jgi:CubicO group peptidase (beta-lactamase class C family)